MGPEIVQYIESRLEGKLQLEINREKTRAVDLREEGASLNFLGYTFRYDHDRKGRNRKYRKVVSAGESGPAGAGETAASSDPAVATAPVAA